MAAPAAMETVADETAEQPKCEVSAGFPALPRFAELFACPLPLPTPSLTNHGFLPALGVVVSYFMDEGIGLAMWSPFLLGPREDGRMPALLAALPAGTAVDSTFALGLYGAFIAVYPLAQICFSVTIGAASDELGRKPVLVVCMLAFALSNLLMLAAVECMATSPMQFWALCVARLLRGCFGGVTAVMKAVLADHKQHHNQRGYDTSSFFVYFGFSAGLGRLAGTSLGGFGVKAVKSYSLPFLVLMAYDAFVACWLYLAMEESRPARAPEAREEPTADVEMQGSTGVAPPATPRRIWRIPWQSVAFCCTGLLTHSTPLTMSIGVLFSFRMGWMLFANYLSFFLSLGGVAAAQVLATRHELEMTVWVCGSLAYLVFEYLVNQPLSRLKIPGYAAVSVGVQLCIQAPLVLRMTLAHSSTQAAVIASTIIALNSFGTPNTMALVSNYAPSDRQGQYLAGAATVKALTYLLSAVFTGLLGPLAGGKLPMMVSAALLLVAAILALRLYSVHDARGS